ncbi:MAG: AMP-binding protein [Polyangiales bacterium]
MSDGSLSVFAAAREAPTRDALVWEGNAWSYATLAAATAAHCDALRALGVGSGARVAVQATNRPATVCSLLALMELGATAVVLHPRLTTAESQAQRDDAAPAIDYAPDDLAHAAALPAPTAHAPDDVLAMLFTSGTSGRAKAALLPRRAFLASARASAANLGWRDDDRWLLCLPVCHVGGLSVLTRSLAARRCVVLHGRFDPAAILASVANDRATLLSVVPTMLRALLDADAAGDLARLRAVLVGGAATPMALLEACAQRRVRALTTYGLTEACSQVTTQRLPPAGAPFVARAGSGPALEGVELAVVRDDGSPCEVGEVGRIRVRGASVMAGYLGHAPLDGGWLDTGDLGSFDAERSLHVAARRTDLIVTGGENVYPAEVEASLCELPGVRAAVVFGEDDPVWGQRVAAAIVRDRTNDPRGDDAWLAAAWPVVVGAMAPHKRPRRACVLEELPARATGKVDRAAVAREAAPRLRPWG